MPRISATSFCVFFFAVAAVQTISQIDDRLLPVRKFCNCPKQQFVFYFRLHIAVDHILISSQNIRQQSNSFPSQSTFSGSSIETSILVLLFLRRYIRISFSMHLEAYVASLIFFPVLKVLIALISPIVPMDIRSSPPNARIIKFFSLCKPPVSNCARSVVFWPLPDVLRLPGFPAFLPLPVPQVVLAAHHCLRYNALRLFCGTIYSAILCHSKLKFLWGRHFKHNPSPPDFSGYLDAVSSDNCHHCSHVPPVRGYHRMFINVFLPLLTIILSKTIPLSISLNCLRYGMESKTHFLFHPATLLPLRTL